MSVKIILKKEIQKKLISTLLVLAMLLFMLPISIFAAASGNSDIADHWARTAIEKWSGMGIIKGSDGKFRPDAPITRGELAVIIDRIMKYQTAAKNSFSDLGENFYTAAVLKTNAAGVMKGDGARIRPNAEITREEAVVIIGRALGITEKTGSSSFGDGADISKWAAGYVNSAAEKGYINGYNGLFQPKSTISRAEAVTILDNAVTGLFSDAKEYSTEVNGTAIVNTPGTVLKNMKIIGDLIISEGVGNGTVTLNNVTVTGKMIVRGGGPNSILITGDSKIVNIVILKTDTGKIRVVTSNKAVVDVVYVNDGNDDIILTGSFKNVYITAEAKISAVSADIKSLNVTNGRASINIDKSSQASEVKIANAAAGTSLAISGTVGTLTANARISVANSGTITKAVVNADGVAIAGTAPVKTEFGSNVTQTQKPTATTPSTTTGGTTTGGNSSGGTPGGDQPATAIKVTGITLDKTIMTLDVGGAPGTLTATVTPTSATDKTVTWTSSNAAIATVINGTVTAVAPGTTTITAKTADGGFTASCQVTVNATAVTSGTKTSTDTAIGTYKYVTVSGLTPHVFMPTGAGSTSSAAFTNVTGMMNTYGKSNNIVVAINSGIFYNAPSAASSGTQYCFNYKEADGPVISNGIVLKSQECLDHSECDLLVFDEDGNVGWTDYYADADALAAGTGYYYDIHGSKVTGKKIVSALTGFVPIVIDGKSVYNPADTVLNGYHNYVGHYTQSAVRQIFGVKADGSYGILTNSTTWTLANAADAAVAEGFVFAYNLDGGGSAETVLASGSADSYAIQTFVPQSKGTRTLPTYIVFTSNNVAPVSATASAISATLSSSSFDCGSTLGAIKAKLTVNENFINANGNTSTRKLYSQIGLDMSQTLTHTIIGGGTTIPDCTAKKTSTSPNGTLYYEKVDTETNTISLQYNSNARQDNKYYDYSTGYALSTGDDLSTPGTKAITVSYSPGGGQAPLTTTVNVTINDIIPVTGITLDKTAMALDVGGASGTLTATITPANATNKTVTWTSSNTAAAIVTNGTVIPVAAGTAAITARTDNGGFTATCDVTVTVPSKGVSLNKTAMALAMDSVPGTLKANAFGVTNTDVTWTSDNAAVAAVVNGMITPVSTGSAIITATSVEGGYTATCQVTVDANAVAYVKKTGGTYGNYTSMKVSGLTPYVFTPVVTASGANTPTDFNNVTGMMNTYGKSNNIVVAINSSIFYNAGANKAYCFNYKEPDGVTISNGVVLKSAESIDHTQCDILVFDEDGNVGWTDYYADADALVAGAGYYYDIYGKKVTGKKIVSAVTGFVPILVGGNSKYNSGDTALNGYDNYVGHYSTAAVRQIFGVKADGSYGILTGNLSGGTWTLASAADAAKAEGFVFAYNLDGGGSTETVVASGSGITYSMATINAQYAGTRQLPTYIVFTSNNVAPVSATPSFISTTMSGATFTCGVTLGAITKKLTVTETFVNAKGNNNTRKLFSRQGVDTSQTLQHVIIGGGSTVATCTVKKTDNNIPNGTLYYTKVGTDITNCLTANKNTRQSENYYDYSTGYTLSTTDDLNTPGAKTITVSYIPGNGLAPLTSSVNIVIAGVSLNKAAMALAMDGVPGTLKANAFGVTNTDVTWTSDNAAVAAVVNGMITPVSTGSAIITATSVEGGYTATCQVTVDANAVAYVKKTGGTYGNYTSMKVSGLTPYVFTPVVTASGANTPTDFNNVTGMMNTYGKSNNIVVAINSSIFYNAGANKAYCFNYKEPDGVTISNGVVLKSAESIDHTQCDILVFDEDGNVGWTDYYADADALVAGAGYYYDIYGKKVTGKKIVSAVTGFVPILVGGNSKYNSGDTALNGYDNYVGHYSTAAVRQIFGVKADGSYGILTGNLSGGTWTLASAADAAKAEGFVFAYNLDGGGSTETVVASGSGITYSMATINAQYAGTRQLPTYIVFTSNNVAPVSATPSFISTTMSGATFTCGVTLGAITKKLTVTETFVNAKGNNNTRKLFSRQGVDTSQTLQHVIIGGGSTVATCTVKKTDNNIPNGTLYYTKVGTDITNCLTANKNTRQSENYYDYSTGYTLSTTDDLNTPGVKTITASYVPGYGLAPLTTTFDITVANMTLDQTALTMQVGDAPVTLVATVTPVGAVYKSLTWTSSNTNVATVTNGAITALAVGTVTITARTDEGLAATCVVTVNATTSAGASFKVVAAVPNASKKTAKPIATAFGLLIPLLAYKKYGFM